MIKKQIPYAICTVPRTGSHYLEQLLCKAFNLNFKRQHDPSKNSITIARDPLETITSNVAMRKYFYGDEGNIISGNIKNYIEHMIKLENSSIIIKHEDLQKNSKKIIQYFAYNFNLSIKNINPEIILSTNLDNKYLPTSVMNHSYKEIMNEVLKYDLSECYTLYNKMLEKAIKLD